MRQRLRRSRTHEPGHDTLRKFSSPQEGSCSQRSGWFFPALSAARMEGLTPPSTPACKRSQLTASMRKMLRNESAGGLCASFPSLQKGHRRLCSCQEHLLQPETLCRKGIPAPVLALQAKPESFTPQLPQGTGAVRDAPDLPALGLVGCGSDPEEPSQDSCPTPCSFCSLPQNEVMCTKPRCPV